MEEWKFINVNSFKWWSEMNSVYSLQSGFSLNEFKIIVRNLRKKWIKMRKMALGLLVGLLIVSLNSCSSKDVTAIVTFEKNSISMELNVPKNYEISDFVIELLRGGTTYESAKGLKYKTFDNLNPGIYYVNVKYIGQKTGSSIPNIIYDKTTGPYTIIDIPITIQDSKIHIIGYPAVPNSSTKKYTLTIKISPESLKSTCEYSVDGKTFQKSNIFVLSPGTYNLVVRSKDDPLNQDKWQLSLKKIQTILPTQAAIQGFLNKISNGNNNSFNQLSNLVSAGNINIIGAGGSIRTLYDLMVDCYSGGQYEIQNMKEYNNQIISINVRKSN